MPLFSKRRILFSSRDRIFFAIGYFFGLRPILGRDPEKSLGRDLDLVEVPNTTVLAEKQNGMLRDRHGRWINLEPLMYLTNKYILHACLTKCTTIYATLAKTFLK
jgi:hypothetical protein